jgi:ribonucleoside-diphosphate reductase alpha chain
MTSRPEAGVADARGPFMAEISRQIWDSKYRFRSNGRVIDQAVDDGWQRIARAVAAAEPVDRHLWRRAFRSILEDFCFLPGGRIQAGAGTGLKVTLLNCFVMGNIEDSMEGIFQALHEGAITMQQGGGVGYDFSTLRPRGAVARGVGAIASGPVSFMTLWDAMCEAVLSMGSRRGAMMATLRCDHPDIEKFVVAKQRPGALRHFNLSVQVTDAFMQAVRSNADWDLVFPANPVEAGGGEVVLREWPGYAQAVACRVHRRLKACELWRMVLRCAYDHAEPGVLFIDCINRSNNLAYCERITATNPCGEVPLPPYGACDLGSINLTRFIRDPFGANARFEEAEFSQTVEIATRFLDDVIDVSRFPLRQQAAAARRTRRIGLGITGLADALIMLGLEYGSEEARAMAAHIIRLACLTAYRTSIRLAAEKGSFPVFIRDSYLASPFISALPVEIRDGIAKNGVRNSHLLAIAPTGSISLLANNVSSGIEPVFAASYDRKVLDAGGFALQFDLTDYAVSLWRGMKAKSQGTLPPAFRSIGDLSAREHLLMQAALQPFVDNAISKTINVLETYPFEDFCGIYDLAYDLALKGCTTFRLSLAQASILTAENEGEDAPHCCAVEREAD